MATISSSVSGPITLSSTLNPLTISSTGTITSSGSSDAIDGASGAVWNVTNNGTLKASTGYGVSLSGAGMISSTGLITGKDGLVLRGVGSVVNSGSIGASGSWGGGSSTGAGVFMTGAAGTVSNSGTITGPSYGVALDAGGLVTNTSSITGGEDGVRVTGAAGSVINSGTIISTVDDGIGFFAGGSVSIAAGGLLANHGTKGAAIYITGGSGTLTNAGSIVGKDYVVYFSKGGSVANNAGGSMSGNRGVFIQGGSGSVSNSGNIAGTSSFGIRLTSGGQVTNASGGSISGGIQIYVGAGTVTNSGAISGSGTAVLLTGSGANRVVAGATAVFVGGVTGSTASGSTNTFELAGGTGTVSGLTGGAGTVTENAHSWAIKNFNTIAVDAGSAWTFSGNNTVATILNNGTIDQTGSLVVTSGIDSASTGVFQIDGKSFEIAAALGAQTQISFLGASELTIDKAGSFGTGVGTGSYAGPLLENFASDDKIDLKSFSLSGVSFNFNAGNGVLQISNSAAQVASLEFQTVSLGGGTFHAASDGASGIFITNSGGTISVVTEQLVSDTGASVTDRITSNDALSGTADPNAVVTLKEGATTLGSTTASGTGAWSFTPSGLSQGVHTIVASESNGASASLTFTYDTIAPAVTEKLANDTGTPGDNITSDPTLTGSGDPNAVVTLKEGASTLGTATADGSGNWTFFPSGLSQGAHMVVASETDLAGNTGSASLTFTYSSVGPVVTERLVSDTGSSSTDNITANAALTGSADANAVVTLTEGASTLGTATANGSGVWTFTPAGLSQGAHTVVASETDSSGNTGSASLTFTYDTVVPAVTEQLADDTGTPGDNITSDPTLTGSGDPNTVVTIKEGASTLGTATRNGSGSWTFAPTGLSQGAHTVVASETDLAGNTGSASLTFTLTATTTTGGGVISSSVTGPITLTGTLNPLTITSNGTVTSTASAADAIDGSAGTTWNVTNNGVLSSSTGFGISLSSAGLITNTGSISGGHGIRVGAAAGTLTNSGKVSATTSDVIGFFAGGSVTNLAGGVITSQATQGASIYITGTAGAVTNTGSITGIDYAVDIAKGGSVSNNAGGVISGHRGVQIAGNLGTVSNSGSVIGTTSFGVRLAAGGQVTNAAGASISGPTGVQVYAASGTVTNSGTISGTSNAVLFTGSGANRVVAGSTAAFVGGVTGSTAAGSTNTLELAGGTGTISGLTGGAGTVTENAHSWAIKNFSTIAVDSGGAWTLSGNNTIASILNDGTIDLTGSLVVTGAVDAASTGVFQLDGKSLETA
ncbi:MAG: hypothetical protein JO227_02475, partial [Acetobacteraceae bacterium]|nr:hypothetical protein [Acetobacteraceae bacterium]